MTEERGRHELATKRLVYEIAGADAVTIRPDVEYRAADAEPSTMNIYYPPDAQRRVRTPVIVIVAGYPDVGFEKFVGCKFKEMQSSIGWNRLITASGLVAITYGNRQPAADLDSLIRHVRENDAALGIDGSRIGIWASSGNVPLALSVLVRATEPPLRCAVLCYGYMLDLDGSSTVADTARMVGFVNPCAGASVSDLPADVPLFIARAGRDEMPGLNAVLDRFVAGALACNLPLTVANHPKGPHAFDLVDDSEASREIIRQILAFLRRCMLWSD